MGVTDHTARVQAASSPRDWKIVPLEEIAEINPRLDKTAIPDDLPVSFVPMPAVGAGSGSIDVSNTKPFKAVKKGFTPFQEGDVLFAKITPCMENGKMAVVPKLTNGYGFGSTEFHVLRPKPGIDARYLYYYVSNKSFRAEAERHMSGAVGQKRVPTAYIKEAKIPVAPFDQQQRIVAEIEKQFSRLDEAVANLKRVKANLKRYKAAVLKAAVEGKLTEEWRKQHPDVESASELLKHILEVRRSRCKGRYKEPSKPDTASLPRVPDGWVWATVDELTWLVTSGSRGWKEYYSTTGALFIRAQDIKTDSLNISQVARVQIAEEVEGTRSSVSEGDILVTITGANVTKAAIVRHLPGPAFVSQHVALLKLCIDGVSPFLYLWVVSPVHGRRHLERLAYGAGKPGLSLEQLRNLPVALPPLAEQDRIVAEVERSVSVIEGLGASLEAEIKRAEHLRRSVLQLAFLQRIEYGSA